MMTMPHATANRNGIARALIGALVVTALAWAALMPAGAAPVAAVETVPKAECGPDDLAETALQGQVPMSDRLSGRSLQGYNCNLKLVGEFQGEGASWQQASYGDCAYYDTANRDEQEHRGTVVVDVSDPENPTASAYLDEAAMLDPWESLKVNHKRGLLAGVENGGPAFAIYDISKDCRKPKLLGEVVVPGGSGHAGNFTPDGKTYYGAAFNGEIYAIDVSNPRRPKPLVSFTPPGGIHDMWFSPNGKRAYLADSGRVQGVRSAQNGLVILDVSEIQTRKKNPKVTTIGTEYWDDGGIAQMTQRIKIKGKPYILFADENGSGGLEGWHQACGAGLPPFGFARLIDISNEAKPKVVSKLMLETHDPANCPLTLPETSEGAIFVYDSHYCSVDRPRNARYAACTYFESGMRVFDIRNPAEPTEIAYFNPPARPGFHAGSNHNLTGVGDTADWSASTPQWRLKDCQIWNTSHDGGFQVLEFTNGVLPCAKSGHAGH